MEQAITVGRIVYYKDAEERVFPAIVTNVNEEGAVNLQVFTSERVEAKFVVEKGEGTGQWDWMPFQKDQQARLEETKDVEPEPAIEDGDGETVAPEVPETSGDMLGDPGFDAYPEEEAANTKEDIAG